MEAIIQFFVNIYNAIATWAVDLYNEFIFVMIENNRYDFIIDGLKNTFIITLGSLAIGIVIGVIYGIIIANAINNTKDYYYYYYTYFLNILKR